MRSAATGQRPGSVGVHVGRKGNLTVAEPGRFMTVPPAAAA
jgi:hypothetical protein